MLYPISLAVPAAVFLPNAAFFVTKPTAVPHGIDIPSKANRIFTTFERIGQAGVLIAPLFSRMDISSPVDRAALVMMAICLGLYYWGWIRYFACKREYRLLFAPMLGIPVPMAISPVAYFLFASILLRSPYLLIADAVLAFGHIPISFAEARKMKTE